MNILEIQEKIMNLREELTTLVNESEARSLEENENSRLEEIRSEIADLEAQKTAEEERNKEIKQNTKIETKIMKEVRLYDLIRKVSLGESLSDEERQYVNGSKINFRTDIQAGVATAGQENVPEEKKSLDVAIRNASVLNRLGCVWFGSAVGDISIPKYAGSNVGWKGEIEQADNGEGAFSEVILQPKRLTAVLNVSKTFLAQDSNDAEAILIRDLADAVAEKLDKTVFGAESGSTVRPAGLFADGADYVTTGGTISAITYDDVLGLELAVEEKNGTNFTFVASPQVKYALKGTQMASGLQMVYSGNEIDGYRSIVSNSVEKGGVIALDPRDLAVATWKGIEITVDPFTRADYNEIRLVVNYLVDAKLRGDRIAAAIFE